MVGLPPTAIGDEMWKILENLDEALRATIRKPFLLCFGQKLASALSSNLRFLKRRPSKIANSPRKRATTTAAAIPAICAGFRVAGEASLGREPVESPVEAAAEVAVEVGAAVGLAVIERLLRGVVVD